jgi:hypothetical protein
MILPFEHDHITNPRAADVIDQTVHQYDISGFQQRTHRLPGDLNLGSERMQTEPGKRQRNRYIYNPSGNMPYQVDFFYFFFILSHNVPLSVESRK